MAALATVSAWGAAGAQEASPAQHPAHIRLGTCAEPGDVVALLVPISAEGVSMAQGPAVATSITEVPLPLAGLTGEAHAITIGDPGSDAALLCAAISGPLVDGPGLATALTTENGEAAGIGWLRELGLEATTVHLFLLAEDMAPADEPPSPRTSPNPEASPSPAPSASPEAEGEVAPEGELDPSEDIDVDVAT